MVDFKVTPYEVEGDVDYDKLIDKFGTEKIDDELLEKVGKYGEPHHLLKKGVFFSHRDFDKILDDYEEGTDFYLYTGRGPSGKTHLGHLIPYMITKYLQDVFDVKVYFQLTNDEKFLYNQDLSLEDTTEFAKKNALDFLAFGFDPDKTNIILDTRDIKPLYETALKVAKRITCSKSKAVFGFEDSTNVGMMFFTALQSAPAFIEQEKGNDVNCLIPHGIDQDPHFRISRDVAPKLGYPKPASIHSTFFPSLKKGGKMSSSDPDSAIFVDDSPEDVKRKVQNAYTGGKESSEAQREEGGDPSICNVFKYLYFFESMEELEERRNKCQQGEILCGECKMNLIEKLNEFLSKHRERKEEVDLEPFLMDR